MRYRRILLLLALLLASSSARCAAAAQPDQAPWRLYHKTDDMLELLIEASFRAPELVHFEMLTDSASGAQVPVVSISNNSGARDATAVEHRRQRVLLNAGEHAREAITSEIAYWLVLLLSGGADQLLGWQEMHGQPPHAPASSWAQWAEQVLLTTDFKVRRSPCGWGAGGMLWRPVHLDV